MPAKGLLVLTQHNVLSWADIMKQLPSEGQKFKACDRQVKCPHAHSEHNVCHFRTTLHILLSLYGILSLL